MSWEQKDCAKMKTIETIAKQNQYLIIKNNKNIIKLLIDTQQTMIVFVTRTISSKNIKKSIKIGRKLRRSINHYTYIE